jgi:hypothetical protein
MFAATTTYPTDYDDEDKAEYDYLMTLGKGSLGTVIPKNQEFLLSIATKMTIRERKGEVLQLTSDEIEALRAVHNEHLKEGLVHQTPRIDWAYSPDNPINQPYMPAEVMEQIKEYDEEYKKTVEEEVAKEQSIKDGWVKCVPIE